MEGGNEVNNEKDHVAGLAIQIPENLIKQAILAEVAKALPPDRIVAEVVRMAMGEKRNSYDRSTIFEATITAEIQKLVKEIFNEWLKTQKDKIRENLVKELEKGGAKRVKEIATKLADGLSTVYVHQIHLAAFGDEK